MCFFDVWCEECQTPQRLPLPPFVLRKKLFSNYHRHYCCNSCVRINSSAIRYVLLLLSLSLLLCCLQIQLFSLALTNEVSTLSVRTDSSSCVPRDTWYLGTNDVVTDRKAVTTCGQNDTLLDAASMYGRGPLLCTMPIEFTQSTF